MPITIACTCGRSLRVADENAGRRVQCPICQAILAAPRPNRNGGDPPTKGEPVLELNIVEYEEEGKAVIPMYGLEPDDESEAKVSKEKPSEEPLPNLRRGTAKEDGETKKNKKRGSRGRKREQPEMSPEKQREYVRWGLVAIPLGILIILLPLFGTIDWNFQTIVAYLTGICLVVFGILHLYYGMRGKSPP